MTQFDRITLGRQAKELGFVRDTFEKVCRLADVLAFLESDALLSRTLALKGGTAINLTIFDLPRLSVDIDLDYSENVPREEMLAQREIITERIRKYMAAAGYRPSLKSKTYHALDSFVFEYVNAGGMKDNLKIEINYMLRAHVLPTTRRAVRLPWNNGALTVLSVAPIEIFASKIVALINRTAARDKHHLVIDEETAPTVRRIFAMRAAGTGFRAIAVTLNEEGVLPPGALYYQRKGRSDPRNVNHKWAEPTVKALIRSEVYIGNMVQGKTGTLSYKSRKLINKPEEEWIRVEGTHEPIISREVWDTVVSIDKKKVRKTPPTDGIRSIFTGLVYCADCGFKMRNHIERFTYKDGTPGRYSSFICGNYARSGKSACTIHSIYENVLEELVLTDIREKARFVECDGERLAEQISRMKEKESRSRVISYEQELKAAAARMIELERLMQNLYEDKCTGTIPQTVFQTLMRKYETERAEKAAAIPELEQKVRAQLENRQDANRWMEVIRRYTEITALDESILFELVDRIEVGEARKVNGQRICDVKVVYRYVGSVDDALAQERQDAYEKAI